MLIGQEGTMTGGANFFDGSPDSNDPFGMSKYSIRR